MKGSEGDPGRNAGAGQALLGLGLTFAVFVAACVIGGVWLDRRFGTLPWLTLLGVVIGLGLGGFWLYVRLKDDVAGH